MVADPGVVPLDSSDFVVNGLSDQADTSAVKARFGRPDSITSESNPFSEGGKLYSWYYRDAVISLINGDSGFIVLSMNLMGPRQATARGARVGDASDRLLTLYGEPTDRDDRAWMYEDPEQSLHQIVFLLRDGRITRIFLGTVLD